MDEILKSVKAYLYDKSTSPLFGCFVISWLVWNYRVVLTIFSGESLESKFRVIEELFETINVTLWDVHFNVSGELVNAFMVPAIATIFYIYVYPFLAKPVYEHSLSRQKELRVIKQKEENNRLLSVEESRELYQKLAQLQDEADKETERYRKQVSSLSQTIVELQKETETDNKHDISHINDELNDFVEHKIESIIKKVASMSGKEFQLSDLFDEDEWNGLTSTVKNVLGKRFKELVEKGEIGSVSVKGKDSGNILVYVSKDGNRLSPDEESILMKFAGLDEDHGYAAREIQKITGWHIDKVRADMDELASYDYLYRESATDTGQTLYLLSQRGRKYLVDNDLLNSD